MKQKKHTQYIFKNIAGYMDIASFTKNGQQPVFKTENRHVILLGILFKLSDDLSEIQFYVDHSADAEVSWTMYVI